LTINTQGVEQKWVITSIMKEDIFENHWDCPVRFGNWGFTCFGDPGINQCGRNFSCGRSHEGARSTSSHPIHLQGFDGPYSWWSEYILE